MKYVGSLLLMVANTNYGLEILDTLLQRNTIISTYSNKMQFTDFANFVVHTFCEILQEFNFMNHLYF